MPANESFGESQDLVRALYQGILRREPDEAGLTVWADSLRNGMPLSELAQKFVASEEFQSQRHSRFVAPETTLNGVEKALCAINPSSDPGVEIGPLMNPRVPRDVGPVKYIDRASTADLRKWYSGHPNVDLSRIVEVDYVWGDQTLSECVSGETFKYCIASHVVEHVPDLVTWLREVSQILDDGGILSLVVPDRRYTFDFLRRTSGIVDVMDAYVRRQRKPSPRQIFDHFSHFVNVEGLDPLTLGERRLKPQHPPSVGLSAAIESQRTGAYVDAHCWVFTSDTFIDLLADIATFDLLDFEIVRFFPTEPGVVEFHVSLRKLSGLDLGSKRRIIMGSLWEARYQNSLLTRG
jgi:hypothetical protein